jgi:transposase
MKEKIVQSKVIWTDDTPVKMQDRQDDRNMRNARVWCYLGDRGNPYTVFDFTESRKRDGPLRFLNGFDGFLQADAFAGYDCIYADGRVREVACWAHARRKFFEARGTDKTLCDEALALIGKLYQVERTVATSEEDERLATRQAHSVELLSTLKRWLDRQKLSALPKSPFGKAVTYALNNWAALNTYTTCGALTIDNNKSERTLRGTAVGRKNWLFVGSSEGGKTAAVLCSILATAKQHGLHPRVYLADVLTRLSTYETDLESLLPDRWKAAT